MRIAIISDIHSNLEALESVLERLRREEVDSVLNLGDLVGYNASPAECLALLQSRPDIHNLAGNHDLAVLSPERAEAFNIIAYQALKWCREQVPGPGLEFLQGLPFNPGNPGWWACHGTPTNPDTYIAYHFQGKRVFTRLEQGTGRPGLLLWPHPSPGPVVPGYPGQSGPPGPRAPSWTWTAAATTSSTPAVSASPGTAIPRRPMPSSTSAAFSIQFKSVPYDVAAAQRADSTGRTAALPGGTPGAGEVKKKLSAFSGQLSALTTGLPNLETGNWLLTTDY